MTKKKEVKEGDIFSVKIKEDNYIFGRIVFCPKNQYLKKMTKLEFEDSAFSFFTNALLIETFLGVFDSVLGVDYSQKAVKGKFVHKGFLKEQNIEIVDFKPIKPKDVCFPESLMSDDTSIYFSVGELKLPLPITDEEYDEIKIHPSFSLSLWEETIATLDYSGRPDLITDDDGPWDKYFAFSDLRSFPDVRRYIYSLLGENPNQSYYELSKKHGFDLSRLY